MQQLEIYPASATSLRYTVVRRIFNDTAHPSTLDTAHPSTLDTAHPSPLDTAHPPTLDTTPPFGPIFWATRVPPGFGNASRVLGIRPLEEADPATRADVAQLLSGGGASQYSSQACRGGACQQIADVKHRN